MGDWLKSKMQIEEYIVLTFIQDDWNFDNTAREISLCEFVFGPDMIRSLKRTGLLPPRNYGEFEKYQERLQPKKEKTVLKIPAKKGVRRPFPFCCFYYKF